MLYAALYNKKVKCYIIAFTYIVEEKIKINKSTIVESYFNKRLSKDARIITRICCFTCMMCIYPL